jgi:hypothetical protein
VHANERLIAVHTSRILSALTGASRVLVAEDAEQLPAFELARLFDPSDEVDFLAFLPWPDLLGAGPMFRAQPHAALPLRLDHEARRKRISTAPAHVRYFYELAAKLIPATAGRASADWSDFAAAAFEP